MHVTTEINTLGIGNTDSCRSFSANIHNESIVNTDINFGKMLVLLLLSDSNIISLPVTSSMYVSLQVFVKQRQTARFYKFLRRPIYATLMIKLLAPTSQRKGV